MTDYSKLSIEIVLGPSDQFQPVKINLDNKEVGVDQDRFDDFLEEKIDQKN
jgi:hypothetical protein